MAGSAMKLFTQAFTQSSTTEQCEARTCPPNHTHTHTHTHAAPLPPTGEGPPAAVLQEEERLGAALVHCFEAVDREVLARCRLEGTKGGATGLVVLRIGEHTPAAPLPPCSPPLFGLWPPSLRLAPRALQFGCPWPPIAAASSAWTHLHPPPPHPTPTLPPPPHWAAPTTHPTTATTPTPRRRPSPAPQATSCMQRTAATRALC
jgi:hypothetical protein